MMSFLVLEGISQYHSSLHKNGEIPFSIRNNHIEPTVLRTITPKLNSCKVRKKIGSFSPWFNFSQLNKIKCIVRCAIGPKLDAALPWWGKSCNNGLISELKDISSSVRGLLWIILQCQQRGRITHDVRAFGEIYPPNNQHPFIFHQSVCGNWTIFNLFSVTGFMRPTFLYSLMAKVSYIYKI